MFEIIEKLEKLSEKIERIRKKVIVENLIISTIWDEFLFSELKYIKYDKLFIDLHLERDYLDWFDAENWDSILVFYYK